MRCPGVGTRLPHDRTHTELSGPRRPARRPPPLSLLAFVGLLIVWIAIALAGSDGIGAHAHEHTRQTLVSVSLGRHRVAGARSRPAQAAGVLGIATACAQMYYEGD